MSVQTTLNERGARYGDFTDHARIAQGLQDQMRRENSWASLSFVQKQALTVIADKIARILSGDPNYADNWHDIQGYAKLVEDRIPTAPIMPGLAPLKRSLTQACLVCGAADGHGGLQCPNMKVSSGDFHRN